MISSTNTATTTAAKVSSRLRQCAGASATSTPSRMCSSRRSAITAPSIASQRNRIEASSSVQVSGWLKT